MKKFLLLLPILFFLACEDDKKDEPIDNTPSLEIIESKVTVAVDVPESETPNFAYEGYIDFRNTSNSEKTYTISMEFNQVSEDLGAGFCTATLCYPAQVTDFHPTDDPFTLQPGQAASEVFLPGIVSGIKHGFSIDFYVDYNYDQVYEPGTIDVDVSFINVDDPTDVLTQNFTFAFTRGS